MPAPAGAVFVEATKWFSVVAIAVWLTVARLAAWRHGRKGYDAPKGSDA
jgi:hypothetical protein